MEGEDIIECTISDEECCLQEEDDMEISNTIWVLERGLRLGRKIVITGIVVSSAPLVIPPLITISILGFVGVVPVGFVLVTEKLMSKLLPMPAPPLLLEYPAQILFRDGNRFEEFEEELCGRDFESEFEVHEEMMMDRDGVEKRIELVMDNVAVDDEEGSQYVEKKESGIDENLEGELEDEKETNMDENNLDDKDANGDEDVEKGYEEEEDVECLEAGEHKDNEEIIVVEEVVEFLDAECEDKKDINRYENLEKGYEDAIGEYLEGEHEGEKDNIDENLEKGYEINIDENSDEGYEEAVGEYLEGENEDEKDNINENLEKGYEEEAGEYLEGEHKDNKELIIDEEVVEFLEAEENFEFKSVTLLGKVGSSVNEDEEHLEKPIGFEEEDNKKEARSAKGDENPFNVAEVEITMAEVKLTEASLKENECAPETEKLNEINCNDGGGAPSSEVMVIEEEMIREQISAITISETEKDNIDENLEKGYEEDAGEYLVGEDEDKKEINSEENLDEGYEEAIGDYLEREREDEKDTIDENLEKGYEEDTDEYLEGEDEDKKQINIDENLGEGYEEAIGDYLERERDDEKHNNIDENLEKGYEEDEDIDEDLKEEGYEEDVGEYLEGEHEGPMPEMIMEVERGREEPHFEFGENVKRTEGLDLVTRRARGENYNNDNKSEENFEYTSVTLLVNVSSSVKEDEEHLEILCGFEEEDNKKEATSAKEDENPFNVTDAEVEINVAEVKLTEASLKENECAPETEKHNEINSNEGAEAPSSELMVIEEEKIWEQISAIRGILGYTAAPQSSTVDELKALFILTGVEPPSPFEDPSDLVNVNHKLRLLMSIVGTK